VTCRWRRHSSLSVSVSPVAWGSRPCIFFSAFASFATLVFILCGCHVSHDPPPEPSAPTTNPSRLATTQRSHWTTGPASITVQDPSFEKLWTAAEDTAREYGFRLDRKDRRAGILTTEPVTSKQLFELWRRDTGTAAQAADNTLDSYRRCIHFEFQKIAGGYSIIPRVVIERYTQAEQPITSSAYLRSIYGAQRFPPQGTHESDRALYLPRAYWYATGRDYALEDDLAHSILKKLHP
jgi:hypothetical protein